MVCHLCLSHIAAQIFLMYNWLLEKNYNQKANIAVPRLNNVFYLDKIVPL